MSAISSPLQVAARPVVRVAEAAHVVFPATMALAVAHMLDDAFVHEPSGTTFGSNLATIAVPLVVAVVCAATYARLRPGFQAWLAVTFGAIATAVAALNVAHMRTDGGPSGSDVTGLVMGAAGVCLLATGIALTFRPKAPRRPLRRWGIRAAAAVGMVVTVLYVIMPITVGTYFVDKQPVHVPTTSWPIPHRDVMFHASDGVALAAWYAPSKNGATVILVHGSGGSRAGGIKSRATLLARHGYGVFVYDARGSGDSEGRPEAVGWTWNRDLEGAVDWLAARHVTNVGVLGLSTGAEVGLTTAGDDPRIKAVVGEGTEARTFTDVRELPKTLPNFFVGSYTVAMFTVHHVLAHTASPSALKKQVAQIGPRPILLISAGKSGYERDLVRAYSRAATGPHSWWAVPGADHTGGLATRPREYERRVIGFFDRALSRRRRSP